MPSHEYRLLASQDGETWAHDLTGALGWNPAWTIDTVVRYATRTVAAYRGVYQYFRLQRRQNVMRIRDQYRWRALMEWRDGLPVPHFERKWV